MAVLKKRDYYYGKGCPISNFEFYDKVNSNVLVQCPSEECGQWHKVVLRQQFSKYVIPNILVNCSCGISFSANADNISLRSV